MVKKISALSFDKSLLPDILDAFGNTTDQEGYVVDKDTEKRVLSSDGDYVHASELAGITKGSRVYIKSDIPSLIDFVEKKE